MDNLRKMDRWVGLALKTWYSKDDPKHLDPLHPAMGLAGEAGELIDAWKKHIYKPGYDAWVCRYCKETKDEHRKDGYCRWITGEYAYTPIILDEVGDLTYYARILFYQRSIEFPGPYNTTDSVLSHLVSINRDAARLLELTHRDISMNRIVEVKLRSIWRKTMSLCLALDTDLETVLEMNKTKLLGSEDNHGWKNA